MVSDDTYTWWLTSQNAVLPFGGLTQLPASVGCAISTHAITPITPPSPPQAHPLLHLFAQSRRSVPGADSPVGHNRCCARQMAAAGMPGSPSPVRTGLFRPAASAGPPMALADEERLASRYSHFLSIMEDAGTAQPFLGPFSAVRVHTQGRTGAAAVQGDSGPRSRGYAGSTVGASAGFGGAHRELAGDATLATLTYLQQLYGSQVDEMIVQRAAPPVALPVVAHTPGVFGGSLLTSAAGESTAWADLETILNEMQSAIREVSAASSSAVSGRDSALSVSGGGCTPWQPAGGGDDASSHTLKTHAAQLDALEESLDQVESGLGVSLSCLLRFVCPLRGGDCAFWDERGG